MALRDSGPARTRARREAEFAPKVSGARGSGGLGGRERPPQEPLGRARRVEPDLRCTQPQSVERLGQADRGRHTFHHRYAHAAGHFGRQATHPGTPKADDLGPVSAHRQFGRGAYRLDRRGGVGSEVEHGDLGRPHAGAAVARVPPA